MNGNSGIQPTVELATTNGNGFAYPYPVYPAMGGFGGNGGFGGFGGDGALWLIVLLALIWGGNNNGNGGFFNGGGFDNGYAWLSNGQKDIMTQTSDGFNSLHLSNQIEGIRDDVNDISSQICNGFYNSEIAATNRQMAAMQQNFDLSRQFADCCCENRLGTADLKYTIATENCADRAAISDGIRDVIASQTAGVQKILDQLCNDKIEQKNDIIAQLRAELMYARGQASQDVQTAAIQAGQRTLANEIEQYVLPTPRPAYMVQNPNCCMQNFGCGCAA